MLHGIATTPHMRADHRQEDIFLSLGLEQMRGGKLSVVRNWIRPANLEFNP